MTRTVLTCSCLGTQKIDAERLSSATGLSISKPCHDLCGAQINLAARALSEGKPGEDVVIACEQESARFLELAEDLDVCAPICVDLRDRAGWSADKRDTAPKMAALMAEATLNRAPEKTIDVHSDGLCLIIGHGNVALEAAEQLQDHLNVTVLLSASAPLPEPLPVTRKFDIAVGALRQVTGSLGQFEVQIDGLQQVIPGGRGDLTLGPPRDGARSRCDILLDLRGERALFPAHEKRDGYLRADPHHPPSVATALMAASHLVGTFEKTLHVVTEPNSCAHSRAEKTACTRCLDLCPTGAISPAGEYVSVDPLICAGCGACSAVCPSGAISYDAPPVAETFARIQQLAKAYLGAGGKNPRLLVSDAHGAEMIRMSARYGRGLPADVIPMDLGALNSFGHAEMVAACAAGFCEVLILPAPATERAPLMAQIDIAQAIAGDQRIRALETGDPEQMEAALYDSAPAPLVSTPVYPMGSRRQITRQSARALQPQADQISLPDGAPYGAVLVNKEACTLCLSCVSLCPSGALGDNQDAPQLRFQEDACLQCGLCAQVCPEQAITYEPRLNLDPSALSQKILHEEEPFACVSCGKFFGVRASVERILDKLAGHAMFGTPERLNMIRMCDDCRVNAQFHSEDNPFRIADRPVTRTTEDELSKRRDH